ncbi:MAG: hypothetical protein V1779_12055 [bacterium]
MENEKAELLDGFCLFLKSFVGILRMDSNIYEFDISKFHSGVYLYNILIDGMLVKTGKLNLIR